MFEKAIREGYRFATARMASITTEDLYKLPLLHSSGHSLDVAAKLLSKALREAEEESFVVKKSTQNNMLSLKLDIVKHIISVKLEEKAKLEKKAEKKARNQEILMTINELEREELGKKSIDELKSMLASDV